VALRLCRRRRGAADHGIDLDLVAGVGPHPDAPELMLDAQRAAGGQRRRLAEIPFDFVAGGRGQRAANEQ
jgi:hypothetical protein